MESARLATADDVAVISKIAAQHRSDIANERGAELLLRTEGLSPSEFESAVEANLLLANAVVLVGTYDDVVFGYSMATVEELADGGFLMVLSDFIVEKEIRKSGIGEAMMNLLLAEAERRGCLGIDSRALPGDRDTKNFFESFGLKARMLTVHRSIGH